MASPVIGIRPRYTPGTTGVLDRSHPLADGLQFLFVPAQGDRELARGYSATRAAGAIARTSTLFGPAMSLSSGTTRYSFNGVPDAGFTGPLSILFVGRPTVANNYGYIAGKRTTTAANSTNTPFSIYFQFVGAPTSLLNIEASRGNASSTARIWFGRPTAGFKANQDYTILFVLGPLVESSAQLYVDGVAYTATAGGGGSGAITGNSEALTLGGRAVDNLNSGVVTNVFACWNRQLTAADAAVLHADPYAMLRY